ncbi:signal peptidase II [soil metagenome]
MTGTPANRRLGFTLAILVFAADQFSKYMVAVPFGLRERGQIVITSFFNLTWVENYGVSLGMLTADTNVGRWLLVGLTALISVGVIVWLWREKNRQDAFGLGLVLGGAVGNIIDRVRFSHVVDFADLHFGEFRPFLVFNVADAAITIGVLILLFRALLVRDKTKVAQDA